MTAVVAWGAVSGLGRGVLALGRAREGEPCRAVVARDAELEAAGLARPFCARAPAPSGGQGDRATALLEIALSDCAAALDEALPGWRARRVGLALGTSSGGMRSLEAALAPAGASPRWLEATYLGPVLAAARPLTFSPFSLVLGACASSTLAVGIARAWLEAGRCDVALAGGFDAVGVFVASGFEALRATAGEGGPRPFRVGREGLSLGEGAAVLAMLRDDDATASRAKGFVTGFGASCDAVHLTAPDRTGGGLARAAAQALAEAGRPRIELVSAHGTATEFNDAAEAKAITACAPGALVHAFKGAVGHTLGAAGALEALSALCALEGGVVPATAGDGPVEPGVSLLERATRTEPRAALKLASAFGGANAALVLEARRRGAPRQARRPVFVSRASAVVGADAAAIDTRALADRVGYPEDRIARGDGLVRVAMSAAAALRDAVGGLAGAGIVTGLGLATLETNATYLARILAGGARRAEPRRFPFTTPNAAAGELAIAFGLTGPAFAVGGGPHGGLEALAVAADLVSARCADRVVVVTADEAGEATRRLAPASRTGAVALLVSAEPLAARLDGWELGLGAAPVLSAPAAMHAHEALLPLAQGRPERLEVLTPWGGFANAAFFWL